MTPTRVLPGVWPSALPPGRAPRLPIQQGSVMERTVAVVYAVMRELGLNRTNFGKGDFGRLLRQRRGHCSGARSGFRAVQCPDADLCCRGISGRGGGPAGDALAVSPFWRSSFGDGDEIPAAFAVLRRRSGGLAGERGCAAGLSARHGTGRQRGTRSRPHPPPQDAHARSFHALLISFAPARSSPLRR